MKNPDKLCFNNKSAVTRLSKLSDPSCHVSTAAAQRVKDTYFALKIQESVSMTQKEIRSHTKWRDYFEKLSNNSSIRNWINWILPEIMAMKWRQNKFLNRSVFLMIFKIKRRNKNSQIDGNFHDFIALFLNFLSFKGCVIQHFVCYKNPSTKIKAHFYQNIPVLFN